MLPILSTVDFCRKLRHIFPLSCDAKLLAGSVIINIYSGVYISKSKLCCPHYQLLIFVVIWDSFLCLPHFCFVSSSDLFPYVVFQISVFRVFFVLSCFVVFRLVCFSVFDNRCFTYGTTYKIQQQMWTRYARLGRRLELKRSRFRPRWEKIRSSPHVVLCRHKRGVPSILGSGGKTCVPPYAVTFSAQLHQVRCTKRVK